MSNSNKLVPKKGDVSLNQFVLDLSSKLSDVKTTTDESKGMATVSGRKGGKQFSFIIEQSDLGETRTASVYKSLERKSDYKDEVKRLRRQGLKQNEIALRLGISQSLVSKLLND